MSIKMIVRFVLPLFLGLSINTVWAQEVDISFSGCVSKEGTMRFEQPPRLSQVLQVAAIQDCAYFAGASWRSELAKEAQLKQKQALLAKIDLVLNANQDQALQSYLQALRQLIDSQKVTGRIFASLTPLEVDTAARANRKVMSRAYFHFPKQPQSLLFIGFKYPSIPYAPDWDLNRYVEKNPPLAFTENGWVIVVQPAGAIERRKVGLWTHEQFYAAPGAWILAPVKDAYLPDSAQDFNQQLARWLATQTIR